MRILLAFLLITVVGCGDDSTISAPEMEMDTEMENTSPTRTGSFAPLNGKESTGSVTLNRASDGLMTLNFSADFSVTNGPGLYVILSNDEFETDDAINLGMFISPSGAQTYSVPFGTSLDMFSHVLVYCVPFEVTFAAAELN